MTKDNSKPNDPFDIIITWCPQDGWNDLVPGVSKLTDAIDKFGNYEAQVKFVNGIWYEFANKTVQVVLLDNETTIYKIRVSAGFPDKTLLPMNIKDVEQIYGPVIQIEVDEFGTVTYERPGLRVACRLFDNPQPVKWLEFYSDSLL